MRRLLVILIVALWLPLAHSTTEVGEELAEWAAQTAKLAKIDPFSISPKWKCTITYQEVCSSEGCKNVKPSVWIELDAPMKAYRRCDKKGCNSNIMECSRSGIYTVCSGDTNHSFFIKILNDGTKFLEVASSMLGAFNGFGSCKPQK